MKKNGIHLAVALLLAACLAQPGLAESSLDGAYRAADRNGDGVVDRVEFQQRMVDVFYLQDTDKDGRLAHSELPKATPEAFARADSDGDGSLEMSEFLNARAHDFEAADKNGDGGLDREETKDYP